MPPRARPANRPDTTGHSRPPAARRVRRAAGAGAAALLAALCLPAPAARASPQISYGNYIINKSSHRLRLVTVVDPQKALWRFPYTGSIIMPRAQHHVDMTFYLFRDRDAALVYDVLNDSGTGIGRFTAYISTGYADELRQCTATVGRCDTSEKSEKDGSITFYG